MRDFLAQTLAESPTREWMVYLLGNVPGLPPISQSFHIMGIATVVGSIVMVDLRFLGLALPGHNVSEMIRRLLPWTWYALAVNAATGLLFILARPIRYFYNPVATFKFSCLLLAVGLAFVVFRMNRKQHGYWEQSAERLLAARVIAAVSLLLWIGVMLGGRWIAYSEYITDPFEVPFVWEDLAGVSIHLAMAAGPPDLAAHRLHVVVSAAGIDPRDRDRPRSRFDHDARPAVCSASPRCGTR